MRSLAAVLALLVSASAVAQDTPWYERVKFSGKAYVRYTVDFHPEANGANAFSVDRAYLTAEFTPVELFRFQLTLDAGDTRNAGTNTVPLAQLKFAFVEAKDLGVPGWFVRGGLIPVAWNSFGEELWGFRSTGPIPADRWGYISSADFGVAVGGTLPQGFGTFYADVINGEGFKATEGGKGKEAQIRLTLTPLAPFTAGTFSGLFITSYASVGRYDDANLPVRDKVRLAGQIGLRAKAFMVAAEHLFTQDPREKVRARFTVANVDKISGGTTAFFGVLRLGEWVTAAPGLKLLARADLVDPDVTITDNGILMAMGGVAYEWNRFLETTAVVEHVEYGRNVGGVGLGLPQEHRVKVVAEARF